MYKFVVIKMHINLVYKFCCSIHLSLDNVEDINKRRFCYLDPLSKIPAIWHVSFVIERIGVIEINGVLSARIVNNVNWKRYDSSSTYRDDHQTFYLNLCVHDKPSPSENYCLRLVSVFPLVSWKYVVEVVSD